MVNYSQFGLKDVCYKPILKVNIANNYLYLYQTVNGALLINVHVNSVYHIVRFLYTTIDFSPVCFTIVCFDIYNKQQNV